MYRKADVVNVFVPYSDMGFAKLRPVLVTDIITVNNINIYKVYQLTGTDRSNSLPGIWVERKSNHGRLMKLTKDSFIDLSKFFHITEDYIKEKRGWYKNMKLVDEILNNQK